MIRRNTNQSQIVYKSIEFMGHTTSERLIEYINSNYENISLATIYRNLSKLLEEGQIKKLRLGQEEIYETVKEKHYHFKCRLCGNIVDIPTSMVPFDFSTIKTIDRNDILDCDIVFQGVCHNCIKK